MPRTSYSFCFRLYEKLKPGDYVGKPMAKQTSSGRDTESDHMAFDYITDDGELI